MTVDCNRRREDDEAEVGRDNGDEEHKVGEQEFVAIFHEAESGKEGLGTEIVVGEELPIDIHSHKLWNSSTISMSFLLMDN